MRVSKIRVRKANTHTSDAVENNLVTMIQNVTKDKRNEINAFAYDWDLPPTVLIGLAIDEYMLTHSRALTTPEHILNTYLATHTIQSDRAFALLISNARKLNESAKEFTLERFA